MTKFELRNASGFPVSQNGAAYIEGNNLVDAVEQSIHGLLEQVEIGARGNVAGYRIVSLTVEPSATAFPPPSQSITWGRYSDKNRLKGDGIVITCETVGLDLAHSKASEQRYVNKFYLASVDGAEATTII